MKREVNERRKTVNERRERRNERRERFNENLKGSRNAEGFEDGKDNCSTKNPKRKVRGGGKSGAEESSEQLIRCDFRQEAFPVGLADR